MRFFIPRDPDTQPVVVDRLGRNLMEHGIDIISMAYSQGPAGEFITLHISGTGTPPGELPIPFRIVTGEHTRDTRLYDHHNVELVNALRTNQIAPLSNNGLVAYQCNIQLVPADLVVIGRPNRQTAPGFQA